MDSKFLQVNQKTLFLKSQKCLQIFKLYQLRKIFNTSNCESVKAVRFLLAIFLFSSVFKLFVVCKPFIWNFSFWLS